MRIQDYISQGLIKIAHRIAGRNNENSEKNGEYYWFGKIIGKEKNASPLIVFDVGANVGNYSAHVLSEMKKEGINFQLHAFEPTRATFTKLQNRCQGDEIVLNNFGLSDADKNLIIHYDTEGSGLASVHERNIGAYGIRMELSEEIKVRSLNSYITENKISRIDFMKIDVEGHELSVLRGAGDFLYPGFIHAIQFEYGGCNLDSHTTLRDLYELFQLRGFSVFQIHPKKLTKITQYHPRLDDFQYQNYIALPKDLSL